MNLEHFLAPAHIGQTHNHAPVEAPGPQQRRIEHVGPVGGSHQDHAVVRLKAVHLHEQLIQRLLALVVSAAQAGAAMAAHRVDFIDEDDARCILLALLKQVAHAARAHADEHLNEIRTGDGEEGNVGLAGHRARQQSLAGSRRAHQQHALGNAPAQLLELLRLAQVLDNLLQLFLGLIHAGHVFECHLLLLHREQARSALAERKRLVATRLHLPQHEEPHGNQQNERAHIDQQGNQEIALRFFDVEVDLVVRVQHRLDQVFVVRRQRSVKLVFG